MEINTKTFSAEVVKAVSARGLPSERCALGDYFRDHARLTEERLIAASAEYTLRVLDYAGDLPAIYTRFARRDVDHYQGLLQRDYAHMLKPEGLDEWRGLENDAPEEGRRARMQEVSDAKQNHAMETLGGFVSVIEEEIQEALHRRSLGAPHVPLSAASQRKGQPEWSI